MVHPGFSPGWLQKNASESLQNRGTPQKKYCWPAQDEWQELRCGPFAKMQTK
jgi:SET domain-containing protein